MKMERGRKSNQEVEMRSRKHNTCDWRLQNSRVNAISNSKTKRKKQTLRDPILL